MWTRLRRVFHVVWMAALAAGCGHSEPFAIDSTDHTGPFVDTPQHRLTFSPGDDLLGGANDSILVYTAYVPPPAAFSGDGCLVTMPVRGGPWVDRRCPDTTTVDVRAWLAPAPSPDGRFLAFVSERRASRTSTVVSERRVLVLDRVTGDSTVMVETSFTDDSGAVVNAFRDLAWTDADHVRFLGAHETFGNLGAVTPAGLYELDRSTGAVRHLPTGVPHAWGPAADGLWIVRERAPDTLYHVADDGTTTAVAVLPGDARGVADLDGDPVVFQILPPPVPPPEGRPAPTVMVYDRSTGMARLILAFPGTPDGVRAVPGHRAIVVQLRTAGGVDLWYQEIP